jgi:hypothetical protein
MNAGVLTPRRQAIPVLTLTVLVWLCPSTSSAAQWFVARGATGTGTSVAPFGSIQAALAVARAGDTITIAPGTYPESLRSVRSGTAGRPIVVQSAKGRGSVIVTSRGRTLTVTHAHLIVIGLVFDGQYGEADLLRIQTGADFFLLKNSEVRRTGRDAIDIDNPQDVAIENTLIHHALDARNGRTDAHGIVAGPVRRLTIRDTEVHTFSGDAVQIDPGRAVAGWSDVLVEGCRFWLAPLPAPENGFDAGVVPGENAIDTKAARSGPRGMIAIRDTVAWGFRNGLITNMAAFNLKENIDAVVDSVTVRDSEIAFRLRGAANAQSASAWVRIQNAVIYRVGTAFRYEDNIENLRIWNSTIGADVTRSFNAASARTSTLDVRNVLILGSRLPAEARHFSNLAVPVTSFVSAEGDNYRLVGGSRAIDAGVAIPEARRDRDGTNRPQGARYDVGAFEYPPDRRLK